MKATVLIEKEVTVKTLYVNARPRYWEDATVNGVEDENGNLIPCRRGGAWCPEIEFSTGKIWNWEHGKTAQLHYKVCDDGEYSLSDESNEIIYSQEGYVPDCMCPKDNGYGDYIIMDIDETGQIQNWKATLSGLGVNQ